METPQIIWLIAAALTTGSFIPQVLKVIRTNETKWISLSMYAFFITGVALWMIYWILVEELPVIIANFFTLILASVILGYKIKNRYKLNK